MVQAYALTRAFLACSFLAGESFSTGVPVEDQDENKTPPYALLFLAGTLVLSCTRIHRYRSVVRFLYVLSISMGLVLLEGK
ncbi:MAG: hypothetical protein R3D26_18060 [Cyanobacteriota/Melainabacteria group bacterium]